MHQRTPAEYALLETVQRTRASLLEQTNLSPDELRERLCTSMRDEVELHQRELRVERALAPRPVTLREIKGEPKLKKMQLVRQSRLSVMPVTTAEFRLILKMGAL